MCCCYEGVGRCGKQLQSFDLHSIFLNDMDEAHLLKGLKRKTVFLKKRKEIPPQGCSVNSYQRIPGCWQALWTFMTILEHNPIPWNQSRIHNVCVCVCVCVYVYLYVCVCVSLCVCVCVCVYFLTYPTGSVYLETLTDLIQKCLIV